MSDLSSKEIADAISGGIYAVDQKLVAGWKRMATVRGATNSSPTKGTSPKLFTDPKKTDARHHSIIRPYRKVIDDKLTSRQQYWTLAGSVADAEGRLNQDSEVVQMRRAGFCKPEQFYGVDNSRKVITDNTFLFPQANWIHGDIYEVMKDAIVGGTFFPAVVHYDSMVMAKNALVKFGRIFTLLSKRKEPMVLVLNVVLKNPYNNTTMTPDDVFELLVQKQWYLNDNDKWGICPPYVYSGSGRGNKKMCAITFTKTWTA